MARQAAHPSAAGQVYFYEPPTMQQLETLDVDLACQHFAAAFCNPAEFTLCFTGAFEVSNSPPVWLSLKILTGICVVLSLPFTNPRENSALHRCLSGEGSSSPLTSFAWPHSVQSHI